MQAGHLPLTDCRLIEFGEEVKILQRQWSRALLLIATASMVAVAAGCTSVGAQLESSGRTERTITVSGSGTVTATPDEVIVRLGVETEAGEADEALRQNSERTQAVIDRLKETGIPAADIQTEMVQLRPRYEASEREGPDTGGRELAGYVASNIVEASTRDLDAVGQVLDAAVRAGANRVEGIRFEVSNPAELLRQARETAWQDAEEKALQLADLSDAELGDVVSIGESTQGPRPVYAEAALEEEAGVPIEPGSEEIQVQLQVGWALR